MHRKKTNKPAKKPTIFTDCVDVTSSGCVMVTDGTPCQTLWSVPCMVGSRLLSIRILAHTNCRYRFDEGLHSFDRNAYMVCSGQNRYVASMWGHDISCPHRAS